MRSRKCRNEKRRRRPRQGICDAARRSARPAYARFQETQPRRCIFIGSVNPGGGEYLTSTTGNRPSRPIPVKMIDLDALKTNRDQLFAEAVFEETVLDTPISLDPGLWTAAGPEQEAAWSGSLG